jgi:hypothetical protein
MEECSYLYEIKCKGCGRTTEMTVIAGPDYPDIDGIEWLDRQLARIIHKFSQEKTTDTPELCY